MGYVQIGGRKWCVDCGEGSHIPDCALSDLMSSKRAGRDGCGQQESGPPGASGRGQGAGRAQGEAAEAECTGTKGRNEGMASAGVVTWEARLGPNMGQGSGR